MAKKEIKNYEYTFDVKANIINKIYYDEEKNYKVKSLSPLRIFEELEKLQEENSDLKAKLAESEKRCNSAFNSGHSFRLTETDIQLNILKKEITAKEKAITKLKQQLAEKEQRDAELEDKDWYEACIKQLEEQNGKLIQERDNAKLQLAESEEKINMLEEHKFYADNIIQAYAGKCKKANQDKISFAVEQLEKVRSDFEDRLIGFKWSELMMVAKCCNVINDVLDNQIKQLKEKPNDK